MKPSIYLLCALLCAASSAQAGAPVTVLGLPVGGKLKTPAKHCPVKQDASNYGRLCWLESPELLTDGTKMGKLGVPGSDERPKWASYGNFEVRIGKDGILEAVNVRTPRAEAFIEILNSITGRFGQSDKESPPGARIQSASWDRSDISIRLLCSGEVGCSTTFASPALTASVARAAAAEKAKDAARPPSP
jgi:hypothetical protein